MAREGEVEGSRLFILGGKGTSEEEFREVFSEYGEVKDVWIVRDKRTNEDKGEGAAMPACLSRCALSTRMPTLSSASLHRWQYNPRSR